MGELFSEELSKIWGKLQNNGMLTPFAKRVLKPLKRFARVLKIACDKNSREMAVAFSGCQSAGTRKSKVTLNDIKSSICKPNNEGPKPGFFSYFNQISQFNRGETGTTCPLQGNTAVDRSTVMNLCCDSTCQNKRQQMKKKHKIVRKLKNALFDKCMKDTVSCYKFICADFAASNNTFDPETECTVKGITKGSVIADMEIETFDPPQCDVGGAGSQYAVSSLDGGNGTQVSVESCTCATCTTVNPSGTANPSNTPQGEPSSATTELSLSLIGLLSSFFILRVVHW